MEEEARITTVEKPQKTKDPRRVEAGKRLGALSKAAKEKKAMERLSAVKIEQNLDGIPYVYVAAVAVVTLGGLWYGYSKYNTKTEPVTEEKPTKPPLDSFDK